MWTQDWNLFHLCKSISPKAAYGCQKIQAVDLFKYGEYFWPKSFNIHFESDSNLYDVNLKSKDKINHQEFSKYVKSKCDKLSSLNDWLQNFIKNDPILSTTHKVISTLKIYGCSDLPNYFLKIILDLFLDLWLPCTIQRIDGIINWLPRVQNVSFVKAHLS